MLLGCCWKHDNENSGPTPGIVRVDTYIEEMKVFIGTLIIIGISKLPTLEIYWSVNNPDFAPAIIRKAMPRSRFRLLLRFLHVYLIDLPRLQ